MLEIIIGMVLTVGISIVFGILIGYDMRDKEYKKARKVRTIQIPPVFNK